MKSPLKKSIGEVVTDYGAKVMKVFKEGLLGRSLFDFYGDVKALTFRTKEVTTVPTTPPDGKGGVIYTKSADGKLYYKSNEVAEVELSAADTVLTSEQVQDIVGAMFTSNTETRISATYEDSDGTIDLVVDAIPVDLTVDGAGTIHANNVPTLNQNTSGTAAGLSSTLAVGSGGTGATTLTSDALLTGNGTSAIQAESNLTFSDGILTITDSDLNEPKIIIHNTSSQPYGESNLIFKRDHNTDDTDIGNIVWNSRNTAGTYKDYVSIVGEIAESAAGQEGGQLRIEIKSHDGETVTGFTLTDGDAEDEVDVTIGNTTTSLTTISGDLAINGGNITTAVEVDGLLTAGADMRVGGSGSTSNNWITIDAQNGSDTSAGGICFYETGTDTIGAPQYGAKIVYNEDDDEFAIGTMHNNTFMRQIYMKRSFDRVYLAETIYAEGASPKINISNTNTTIADGDTLGQIAYRNEDDDASTLNIKGVATEDHASNSAGGSKFEFQVTPNGTSALATAVTIDQNKDLQIEGDLQVKGNDIKDSGGSAAITFSGSGAVTIPAGNLTVDNHATVSKTLTVGGAGTTPAVGIRTAKIVLSTSDCNSLHTTPVTLVSAAGADTVIVPVTGFIRVDRAATQTNSSADLNFHYDGTSGAFLNSSLVHLRRFMWNETGDRVFNIAPQAIERSQSLTEDVNKHLVVSVDSALTTNCFTSVTIFLTYHVFDIS